MANKQYLDSAGVTQMWNAIKARFLDCTITTAQTVAGGVTFSEAIKFAKTIDIGKTTIAAGGNASAVTITLPSKTGTLALAADIPSVEGFAKLTGNNTWTGDNVFSKNVSGLTFTAASGSNATIYGADTITNSGIVLTLPKKAGTVLLNTDINVANGVAPLDANKKVPTANLPSYVDDIVDCYATYDVGTTGTLSNIKLYSDAAHKNAIAGEGGKEYIDITEGHPGYEFRWTGTVWAQVGGSPLIIGTITGTAYDGGKGSALETDVAEAKNKIVDIGIDVGNKVDKKTTAGSHLYAHTGSTQNEVSYGTAATASNIVQRDSAGQVNLPSTEPGDYQAVSKKWVESQGYGESDAYVKKTGDTMTGALNVDVGSRTAIATRAGISVYGTDTTVSDNHLRYELNIGPGLLTYKVGSNTYMHILQSKNGTIALTSDLSDFAKKSSSNTFTAKENTFVNDAGLGITVRNSSTKDETQYNVGKISNGAVTLTLPTIGGTIALLSDIPSHADYAKLSGNNTFTGTNVFNQGIFSNGDVITKLFEATDGVKNIWKVGNPNTYISIVRDANTTDEYFQFQIGNKDGDVLGSLALEGYGASGGVKFSSPGDIYWDNLETGLFQVLNGTEKIFQISATDKEVVSNVNIDVPDQTQAGYSPSANQLVSKKYCDNAYGTEAIPESELAKILV